MSEEPMPTVPLVPKVGSFFSIWERKSPRHKWNCAHAFVLCTHHSVEEGIQYVSVQCSHSGGWTDTGWTVFKTYACRKLRAPCFDVRPRLRTK